MPTFRIGWTRTFVALLLSLAGPAHAASLSGRVTRSDGGAGIAGASVFLFRQTPFASAGNTSTDANGNFAFANLAEGTYIAGTQPDGFVGEVYDNVAPISFAAATPIPLGPDDVRADIDFALDPLHRVSGVVRRDADASPVEGTSVSIDPTDGGASGNALTDATGAFALDVPSGQYRVRTDSAGGLLGEYSDGTPCTVLSCDGGAAATIEVAGQPVAGVDFALARGGGIAGQLIDAVRGGAPIQPVRVDVHGADGIVLATSVESATGAYQTGVGLPPGSYRAVASTAADYVAQVYDAKHCSGETLADCQVPLGDPIVVAAGATTAGIDFALEPSTAAISGTVTALADGAPLADVRIVLTTGFGAGPVQETLTAPDGSYAFAVVPDDYVVYAEPAPPLALEYFPNVQCASAFDCPAAPLAIVVAAGTSRAGVDFALAPVATIEVALRNADTMQLMAGSLLVDRNGVASPSLVDLPGPAPVQVPVYGGGVLRFAGTASNACGAGGDRACLARLYPDTACPNLRCRIALGGGIDVAKGATVTGIELLLTPAGVIAGRVTRTGDGSGIAALVEASVGVLVVGEALASAGDGTYEITGLDEGPHVVRTRSDAGVVDEVYDDVPCPLGNCSLASAVLVSTTPGARTENIDFALAPGARIGGTVRKADGGAVVRNATVTIFDANGSPVATATTRADGTFLSPALGSGRHFARAEARSHLPALFDGSPCTAASCAPTTGTPIDLVAPVDRPGVDFSLELDPVDLPPPTILYVNRCLGGCTIRGGFESSINNTSTIISGTRNLAPAALGDPGFAEVVACVTNVFAPFNVRVTTTDPGNVPHHETIVAASPIDAGFGSGTGGVSPFNCGVIGNAITFTFASYFDNDLTEICDAVAMEVAHSFGLEHEVDCRDPMTYLPACGPKFFVDEDIVCGEHAPNLCQCGGTTQNSFQRLLDAVGPKVLLFDDGFETGVTPAQVAKTREPSLARSRRVPRGPYCATRGSLDP